MTGTLKIAVPSKGRLKEQVEDYFFDSGIAIKRDGAARGYTGGQLKGVPGVDVVFLQAGEIPAALEAGSIHLGVTGQDLLREKIANPDAVLQEILTLGFGYAKLVVAIPKSWIDVASMADLEDVAADMRTRSGRRMRVATKYITSTRAFFARHGITDYRIVESLGATEGAPNSGAAEIIVDITSSGQTLKDNDLKILPDGVMLESYACLAGSFAADWSDDQCRALRHILDMIGARAEAKTRKLIRFEGSDKAAEKIGTRLIADFDCLKGTVPQTVYAPHKQIYAITQELRAAGFGTVSAADVEYLFTDPNPLYEGFVGALNR